MVGQRSLWCVLFSLSLFCLAIQKSSAGMVFLNGPQLEASDLRQIDSYVASALPIYPKGFQLYGTGSRPIIVKMADPEGTKKQQPNPGYYTNLPAVIPQGFEGVATTSFYLGSPLVFNNVRRTSSTGPSQSQGMIQVAQPSIRVENIESVDEIANVQNNNGNLMQFMTSQGDLSQRVRSNLIGGGGEALQKLITNPVLVETAKFESSLPIEFKNPFYSNENTAASLAHESLPAPGEQVIENDWNTRKIQEGKVRDLLSGAGLI